MTPMVAGIMIVAIASKTGLYFYCRKIGEEANSENVKALAQDHVNDVFSNTGAVLAAWAAYESPRLWWVDSTSTKAQAVKVSPITSQLERPGPC
mmetsp:Transcript_25022/g.24778  ORF Transcript_25022/g.24778 Transcript_25022/m.24778 type:complete len:94 (-) Transcript_25022:71-352(-)